jgi:DNA topoisomerase-1
MRSLKHNGIRIVKPEYHKLKIHIDDETITLTPEQEQMAIAWVKKLSTVYVEDPVFCKNFFEDFSAALGRKGLTDEEIDFSPVIKHIEKQRAVKEKMTKEEKKLAREKRKEQREKWKEYYGTAILDGQEVEIANYTAEPSSIFMGRGEHPMRGKWKEGPKKEDIILNLSDDSHLTDKEEWKEIVWEPECLWVAKWVDKLSGRMKYVWLADNTPIKQEREIAKFDKAKYVGKHLDEIRQEIIKGIKSEDKQIRKVATACYIIDQVNMRVGDEKDDDEADTVGATTLRPEHVTIEGNTVNFDFLGKDCVEWNKEVEFPDEVITILKELMKEAENSNEQKPQIFSDIGSRHVNEFLSSILDELTAKVFRTYHATNAVQNYLEESDVTEDDPDYTKKQEATFANLEAAIICNHMKQEPKNWSNRLQRFRERKIRTQERIDKALDYKQSRIEKLEEYKKQLQERREMKNERKEQYDKVKEEYEQLKKQIERTKDEEEQEKLQKEANKLHRKVKSWRKKVQTANKRIATSKKRIKNAKKSIGRAKERVFKAKEAMKKVESKERIAKASKRWNLNTSLKSYIDPRVYYDWGQEVDYDWKNYYSKALVRKFSWLESDDE